MQRVRRSAAVVVTAVLALTTTLLTTTPANAEPIRPDSASPESALAAAPSRSDGSSNTLFFIHGFDPKDASDTDCSSYWASAKRHFQSKGWRGGLVTYGYYAGGKNCTYKYAGSRQSSLTTISKDLANRIYNGYSRHGRKVDVVAHSMGGLVIRSALYHVRKGTAGFPPYLYVEDVVTLGTPHDGASTAQLNLCKVFLGSPRQCTQMTPGSDFLKGLPETPSNSRFGTDWTVVSSFDDTTVSEGSGVGVNAEHKIQYDDSGDKALDHSELKSVRTGSYRGRLKHSGSWTRWSNREAPLERARFAVYFHASR
ncbi:esterase/lipase family protein [Kribbella deserti]|uniref:Esterase/lipase family protein n=1 Tax=Kribbella deserti TaxID=1926257 RepID=A0ABV6QHF1_9ACTN